LHFCKGPRSGTLGFAKIEFDQIPPFTPPPVVKVKETAMNASAGHRPTLVPSLSRRRFLAASTAAVAAGGLALQAGPAAWAAAGTKLKLGIQLYSLRGYQDVHVALQHAKDLGFEQVEFYSGMFPIDSSPEKIKEITTKVAELGLTTSAHGVNHFGKNAAANRKIFEFAKAAGIRNLSADPDPDAFDSLDELVKEFDIRIAIHNHGPTHRYNKVVDVLRAIEGRDPRIGACADLGHFIRSGEEPTEVVRSLKGRLYGIHLKDFEEMKDKTRGVILGQGHLNVAKVFAALLETGFPEDGALSLEYEENPQDPLDDIRKCVEVARRALQQVS
jgi:inosose dehydratase